MVSIGAARPAAGSPCTMPDPVGAVMANRKTSGLIVPVGGTRDAHAGSAAHAQTTRSAVSLKRSAVPTINPPEWPRWWEPVRRPTGRSTSSAEAQRDGAPWRGRIGDRPRRRFRPRVRRSERGPMRSSRRAAAGPATNLAAVRGVFRDVSIGVEAGEWGRRPRAPVPGCRTFDQRRPVRVELQGCIWDAPREGPSGRGCHPATFARTLFGEGRPGRGRRRRRLQCGSACSVAHSRSASAGPSG